VVIACLGVLTKYLRPCLQNPPKPHFGGPISANILQRALSVSRPLMELYESETLQLHCIGKYLGVRQSFSGSGRPGAQGPLM